MGGSLAKFLSKYGGKVKEGVKAPIELAKAAPAESAAIGGAGALGGLGLGELLSEEEDDPIKKLLMAIGLGE